jgi:hypothetical protein
LQEPGGSTCRGGRQDGRLLQVYQHIGFVCKSLEGVLEEEADRMADRMADFFRYINILALFARAWREYL